MALKSAGTSAARASPRHVLQVVGRLVAVRAVGRVLFVMTVVAVGAVHQRPGDLQDAVDVDEEERA